MIEELYLQLQDQEWPLTFTDHDRIIARAIVFDENGYFYFMRMNRDDGFGRVTLIETSGGGVEKGESLLRAIKRELKEELGADVDIINKIGTVSDYYNLIHRHNINHYFLCKVKSFGKKYLTEKEINVFHLSSLKLTYEEAIKEYEKNKESKLGRLIANRELPILKRAYQFIKTFDKTNTYYDFQDNQNQDFTIIARDCIGGVIYHQLGLEFLTPTINLFFTPEYFNALCLHLKEYLTADLVELKDDEVSYPVGQLCPKEEYRLSPVRVDFMHYETFKEAFDKWEERKQRINWNRIYIVSSFCYPREVAEFSPKLVSDWNKITYPKVMLVDKPYGFEDEFIINKPEACHDYAWLLFQPDELRPWLRTFNEFDFTAFLKK